MRDFYIKDVSYTIGERKNIKELNSIIPENDVETMANAGLEQFCHYQGDYFDLLNEHLSQVAASIDLSQIDGVMINTMSFHVDQDLSELNVLKSLYQMGLKDIDFNLMSYPGCRGFTNLVESSLDKLSRNAEINNILLITMDTAIDSTRSGVTSSMTMVRSDGVASCIVSKNTGDYAIRSIKHSVDYSLTDFDTDNADDAMKYGIQFINCISGVVKDVLDDSETTAEQVDKFIMNNYNDLVIDFTSGSCGFDAQKVFKNNLKQNAHVFSSDSLINLFDLELSEQEKEIMIVTTATYSAGAVLLEKVINE